jgi:signal transduction histidine kinase
MPFSIAARTLLELGKELISSDEVAIYELLKNAIDAGSTTVEITANVVISHRFLVSALELLDDGKPTVEAADMLLRGVLDDAPFKSRRIFEDAVQAAIPLSRSDFASKVRAAYAETNWIDFSDTGEGMSFDDLNEVFLRIGTNSRHRDNAAGATYLGDKGVGRLSAMRLGDILHVRSGKDDDDRWNLLDIDWRIFSHDVDVDLDEVPVDPTVGGSKSTGSSATLIRVASLNADWSRERFSDMFTGKIARMIDPFNKGRANELLLVKHNGVDVLIPSISTDLLKSAHATCIGSFEFDGKDPVIKGETNYRLRQKKLKIDQRGAEILSVAKHAIKRRGKKGHAANAFIPIRLKALEDLGPVTFEIYWYNRRIVEAVGELSETPTQTRAEIAKWAGGPMLYRRDFRILPYGEPNNDWLALDQNAWGESGFKLNRQQVIGRVTVKSKHTALGEQTNREGLVQSDAADALRTLLFWIVHTEMRGLINEADKVEKINRRVAEDAALEFRRTQTVVQDAVSELKSALDPRQQRLADSLLSGVDLLADQCASIVNRVDTAVSEAVTEREKFVHLAGIGLMTEFIFHELNRAVEHTIGLIGTARGTQRDAALQSLEVQLQTLQKRISAFDELAGERRQSKTTFDLKAAVQLVLDNHFNEFERHKIVVEFDAPREPYRVKAVRGMVIQILENLIVNATYWLKEQVRYEPGFQPRIWVRLDPHDRAVTVEDNGPGIDIDRGEHIFQPFISSKPTDQGRGLGLFISRDMAQHHGWKLFLDPEIGRQRPNRSNMFVLDMGS